MASLLEHGGFASGPVALHEAALLTDRYEIAMAASYFRERMSGSATFSLFVRALPPGRSFLVAAATRPDGSFARDVIGVRDEPAPQPAAEALLHPVKRNGRRLEQSAPLSVARERCASQLAALPASVRLVRQPTAYRVEFSERLTALQRAVEEELEL